MNKEPGKWTLIILLSELMFNYVCLMCVLALFMFLCYVVSKQKISSIMYDKLNILEK